MESIDEMKFNNPRFDKMLKIISPELLKELLAICKSIPFTIFTLSAYNKKRKCMQNLFDGDYDCKAIGLRHGVCTGTVHGYYNELMEERSKRNS